jgi:hypothetical protein
MTTKVCPNHKCPAFEHFVYTVGMRSVLCRCDLMPARRQLDRMHSSQPEGFYNKPDRARAAG